MSTSTDPEIGRTFGKRDFVYIIARTPAGIDINATLGAASRFPREKGLRFPGHIPGSQILGARAVGANEKFVGPLIPNLNYQGR